MRFWIMTETCDFTAVDCDSLLEGLASKVARLLGRIWIESRRYLLQL